MVGLQFINPFSGNVTGASMNPARTLGPSIVGAIFPAGGAHGSFHMQYIYWAGHIIGAGLAAVFYK